MRHVRHAFVIGIVCLVLASLVACRPAGYGAAPTPSPTFTPVPSLSALLSRGPYLQSVTASSVVVAWETDQPSRGEVVYGETSDYGSTVADSVLDTRHVVVLPDLAPYTVYHYRIVSGGTPLSEDATFRTAASPEQTEFTFVAFGDTRTQHPIHQTVVDRIVALGCRTGTG